MKKRFYFEAIIDLQETTNFRFSDKAVGSQEVGFILIQPLTSAESPSTAPGFHLASSDTSTPLLQDGGGEKTPCNRLVRGKAGITDTFAGRFHYFQSEWSLSCPSPVFSNTPLMEKKKDPPGVDSFGMKENLIRIVKKGFAWSSGLWGLHHVAGGRVSIWQWMVPRKGRTRLS